jgi:hypothetical protein
MKLNFKFSTFDQLSASNTPLCGGGLNASPILQMNEVKDGDIEDN